MELRLGVNCGMLNGNKLFKRGSYHVAIAYHIYVANLKKCGSANRLELDPTYHARKLKEDLKNL